MIKQVFITACLVFITASFLLLWDSSPESFLRPDGSKVENLPIADSYMSNIKSTIFSEDGTKKYTLEATEIAIFSGLSELKLIQPLLIAYQADSPQAHFEVKAETGTLFKNSQIFEFDSNVNANWTTLDGITALMASNLTYSLIDDSASASGGVQLISPNSKLSGDSLSANFESQILKIKSRVRGTYDAI